MTEPESQDRKSTLKLKTEAGDDVTVTAETHPDVIRQLLEEANGGSLTIEDSDT